MKRFPNKNKMHIQLIPYDSFCFARASVPFNSVFPHLFLLNSHPPYFHPPRGLSNLINAFNSIPNLI